MAKKSHGKFFGEPLSRLGLSKYGSSIIASRKLKKLFFGSPYDLKKNLILVFFNCVIAISADAQIDQPLNNFMTQEKRPGDNSILKSKTENLETKKMEKRILWIKLKNGKWKPQNYK